MDNIQAWNILLQATSLLQLTRNDHKQIEQALMVLKPQEKDNEKESSKKAS